MAIVSGMEPVPVVFATATTADDAAKLRDRLLGDGSSPRAVAVVSGDLGADVGAVLQTLAPVLAEIVFADGVEGFGTGAALAMRALEEFGFGQDFVFTVDEFTGALDYALAQIRSRDHGWEGGRLLVLGPDELLDQARRHLEDT
jgi:hypothetical protein